MKVVIDMNLSPGWVPLLQAHGWEVRHWSTVGPGNAPDTEFMRWAREHGYVVLTQDLDFAQILFASGETGPSVVLLRMDNEFDSATRDRVCAALAQAESALIQGALLTVSSTRARLRHLPITRNS